MTNHEAARQYGQAILDCVSAFEEDDESGQAMNLAVQRALEVGAVSITVDDGGDVTADLSDAIGGDADTGPWSHHDGSGSDWRGRRRDRR